MIEKIKKNKIKFFVFILILVLYGFLVTYQIDLPVADDMARHLKNGESLLHGNFDVLYKNVYSYTMPNASFINHHWFFGLIAYPLYLAVGWGGLVIFKIVVLLLTFSLLFYTSMKRSNFWITAVLSIPTMLILVERSSLRPEIFSYLFISIFLYVLLNIDKFIQGRKIYWLILVQIIWVNTHIFFIVGPVMVLGLLVEKTINNFRNFHKDFVVKKLSILLIGLITACFINPNFINGVLYPLSIFNNYGIYVTENQSILNYVQTAPYWFNASLMAFFFAVLISGTVFLFNIKRLNKELFLFIGCVATGILGFFLFRSIVLFAFIFLPAISFWLVRYYDWLINLFRGSVKFYKYFKALSILAFVAIVSFVFYLRSYDKIFDNLYSGIGLTSGSNDSAKFFKEQGLRGPIFNDYDSGSFLIHHFYPIEKVFVDNRPEAYSEDFFNTIYHPMLANDDIWQIMQSEYDFNTIFVYRYSMADNINQFLFNRLNDPDWVLVYIDMYAIIFVRNNNENKDVIEKYRITPQNIEERMDYLVKSHRYNYQVSAADNFNFLGRSDLGMRTFFNVVERWPDKGKIWMVMGEWELGFTNPKSTLLGIMYLQEALDNWYKTAEVYTFLGAGYKSLGLDEIAREHIIKALRINPHRQDAREILEMIDRDTNLIKQ